MRVVWCAVMVCLLSVVVAVSAAQSAEEAPYELVVASPTVVMALHDNGSNLSCVALDDGLLFFDTGLSTRVARHFRRAMEEHFNAPTSALILTHAHLDHLFGMAAFDDVPVFAAAAGRPRWEQLVALEWSEKVVEHFAAIFPTLPGEAADARLRMPTDWFEDELEFGSGEKRLVIRRTGGHSIDSSSAEVTGEDVVIAGDLVQARRHPYFGEPDTDFPAWIGAIKEWEEQSVKTVCPGHGPVIGADELGTVRRWFEETAAAVAEMKKRGATLEEVLAAGTLPQGYWPDDDPVPRAWAYSLKRLYDMS